MAGPQSRLRHPFFAKRNELRRGARVMSTTGKVYLVGAGPGDPDLLTVKATKALAIADIVVHDRLVSDEIVALAPRTAARLSVGKEPKRHPVPQEEINQLLIRLARGGLTVVRLKGGDPFIFGRGGEEALDLARAGIPFEIVPGITAAQGCAANAKMPLTHRGLATGLRFVTGHCKSDEPLDLDWDSLADPDTTLVVYMGASQIRFIAARLMEHGLSGDTSVLAIANGTRADERRLNSRLKSLADDIEAASMTNPIAFFIGRVAGLDLEKPLNGALPNLHLVKPASVPLVEALHA